MDLQGHDWAPRWPIRGMASCLPREIETLTKRHVFDMVVRPSGCRVIKNCWVFDVKPNGRKRACLVAKGFSQVEGKDFDQIFSPVVRFETVRLILALAALEGWFLSGLDIQNTYLYGELEEECHDFRRFPTFLCLSPKRPHSFTQPMTCFPFPFPHNPYLIF